MPHETHIVRFKVVSIQSKSMPDGQQYTIYYRRGDTSRSTPCFIARGGVVNFSSMPEGAAVIHFKTGHGGRRYAPKYIQFRIEEYTRGAPRRTVGETEVDCTLAMGDGGNQGARIVQGNCRLYGMEATMKVALLVYPEHAPPLTFDGLITPSSVPEAKPEEPVGEVKVMGRNEAMSLLISLETMLERKRSSQQDGAKAPMSRAEKRLKELEDKRKSLTGSEGLATRAVTTRIDDCIDAQFVALARKYRNNFIGATAAYLRQLALQSGVPLTGGNSEEMDEDTMREQLSRATRRIDELENNVKQLEEQQNALGRLQHKMDVTQELCANLDKVASLQAQIKLLEQSKESLMTALRAKGDAANTPINREVKDINERAKTLTAEQEQLRAKVKHMTAIAAGHVLSWARSKNPPEPETKTNVDELFSNDSDSPKKDTQSGKRLDDSQRQQILNAFQGLKPTAPPATARSTSASSSSGHRSPRDLFGGLDDLPSRGDFTSAAKPREEPKKAPATPQQPAKPQYQDPLKPSGLAAGMFAAEPAKPASTGGMGGAYDFSGGSGGAPGGAAQPEPVFDFAAIMRQAEAGDSASAPSGAGGGSAGFSFEPTGASAFSAQPATEPPVSFESGPAAEHFSPTAPPATTTPPTAKRTDDPYYDDIDDYTVPPGGDNGAPAVEFDSDFTFGGGDSGGGRPAAAAAPASTSATAAPAPRPTFNFGPPDADDDDGRAPAGGGGSAGFVLEGGPTFNFGGGGGGGDDDNATTGGATSGSSAFASNLPTYNFGS